MSHRFTDFASLDRLRGILPLFVCGCHLLCVPVVAAAVQPEWIWHPAFQEPTGRDSVVYFRKSFRTPPLIWNSRLTVAADDEAEVFLNGVLIARCQQSNQPLRAEVTVRLNQGENVLGVRAVNRSGPGGLLVQLNLGGSETLFSDASWSVSTNEQPGWSTLSFDASSWSSARSLGAHGIQPWGDVLSRPAATPAEAITVQEGFRVQLVRSAEPEEGSWICLAFDNRGRAIVSAEGERPLLRLTLSEGRVTQLERISAPVRHAMGLLFAYDSFYANAKGPEGLGLYRLVDANGNDQFETNEVRLLKAFSAGSEHGYHALALGPDGKIYVLNGNSVKVPEGISPASPHRRYREDVLSLNPDELEPEGGTRAPEGCILRTDANGKEWELWLGGLRNSYDFDFNADGELFTFDSDMEWDWGTPWYRPTRILHCVSAGEYGWRNSQRSWPDYYPDSLPAAANIGIGSPTGVKFGTKSHFPEKYRRALFAQDWSYGRIITVFLQPKGASYSGAVETFLQGRPLNLTSLAFGPDGALYFTTGGRGTQSGLYRVEYVGPKAAALADAGDRAETATAQARALRRKLEQFHGREDADAVPFSWPHLASEDRWIRYAARIALESQPLSHWRPLALGETNATRALPALLAMARCGSPDDQPDLLRALECFPLSSLSEDQALLKLRALQLTLLRHGKPSGERSLRLAAELNRQYPAASWPLNRELSRLLIYLEEPSVISKTLALIDAALTQEEQIHYIAQLRNLRSGWRLEDRQRYLSWWLRPREAQRHPPELFRWFEDVNRQYVDGASINNYLRRFRREAISHLPPEERAKLAALIEAPILSAPSVPVTPRQFVREWTMADLLPELERAAGPRDFKRGRQAFVDTQCLSCHRFGNDGAAVGPELTAAGSKYTRRDLLESILDPSKVVSDQYQNTTVVTDEGETFTGKLVRESERVVVLEIDPLSNARQEFPRDKIRQMKPTAISPMPEGLVHVLTKEEILDLLAYLESGGRPDAPVYRR